MGPDGPLPASSPGEGGNTHELFVTSGMVASRGTKGRCELVLNTQCIAHCTVLYCAVAYCTVMYRTVLSCCTVLYFTVLYAAYGAQV